MFHGFAGTTGDPVACRGPKYIDTHRSSFRMRGWLNVRKNTAYGVLTSEVVVTASNLYHYPEASAHIQSSFRALHTILA